MASCTQVDSLIQAHIDGELGDSERLILERHLEECRSCAASYDRQKANAALLFESFREYRQQGDLTTGVMAHLPEMDRAVATAHELTWRTKNAVQTPPHRFFRVAPAIAASMLLVLALALFYSWPADEGEMAAGGRSIGMVTYQLGKILRSDDTSTVRRAVNVKTAVAAEERFETGPGAAMMISLAGPSQLKVDENTRVKVFEERKIGVETGRVWLNVCRSPQYFRVKTPSGDVTVFGTTFDVLVTDDLTLVTLEEGEVQVENGIAFATLQPNQQVELRVGVKPLLLRTVNAHELLAWAGAIRPDAEAARLFAETIRPVGLTVMQAEQYFVVDTKDRGVGSVAFEWEPSKSGEKRCGYHVYVSDDHMNPLYKGYVKSNVFDNPNRTFFELVIPEGERIQGVKFLHIKVVPDKSSGKQQTNFTEISARSL